MELFTTYSNRYISSIYYIYVIYTICSLYSYVNDTALTVSGDKLGSSN